MNAINGHYFNINEKYVLHIDDESQSSVILIGQSNFFLY